MRGRQAEHEKAGFDETKPVFRVLKTVFVNGARMLSGSQEGSRTDAKGCKPVASFGTRIIFCVAALILDGPVANVSENTQWLCVS